MLTICGIVIASVILTQQPLLSELGTKGRQAAVRAREKSAARRSENRLAREAERDEWAREEKARIARRAKAARAEKKPPDEPFRSSGKSRRTVPGSGTSPLDYVTLTPPAKGPVPVEKYEMPSFLKKKPEKQELSGEADALFADDSRDLFADMGVAPLPEDVEMQPPAGTEDPETARSVRSSSQPSGMEGAFSADSPSAAAPERQAVPSSRAETERTVSTKETAGDGTASSRKKKTDPGAEDIRTIQGEISRGETEKKEFTLPPVSLLTRGRAAKQDSERALMTTAQKLQQTLRDFGVNVRLQGVSRGPTVTRYELQPEQGVKVSRILSLQDDIKLNLAAAEIRIEAPIPGKAAVGIEVPNKEPSPVMLREIIESPEFTQSHAHLAFAVGKDIGGRPVVADIEKMPHLLIAGATGSGKSVCINTLIMSILFKSKPDEVKMLMIDPKVVELKIYDGIPHLLIPVVTDPRKAAGALNWAVQEMTNRYKKFASYPGVRDIHSYNERICQLNRDVSDGETIPPMPRIVIIVDELADLMMVASSEVEDAICRLAQLARAAGIHLIIATQRPSVNVVTGLIKANMPSRIALAVASGTDSRTIIDMNGAEKLLGHGDMLFYPQGYPKPARVQGCFVSDGDISKVVEYWVSQGRDQEYNTTDVSQTIEDSIAQNAAGSAPGAAGENDRDEFFAEAGQLIIEKEKASIGMLQRAFKIGFNRAARIMDQLAEAGVVGGEEGTKPRKILMTMDEFSALLSGPKDS